MKTAFTIKPKVGNKDILLEPTDNGPWFVSCYCSVSKKRVQFEITDEQVAEILSGDRRNIDQILPDTPAPLREIFLTGLTPEEFEQIPRDEGYTDDDEEEYELE
jgi:hypothetical protein